MYIHTHIYIYIHIYLGVCAYIGFRSFVVVRRWRFEGFSPGFGAPMLRGFGGYRGSGALYMCGLGFRV